MAYGPQEPVPIYGSEAEAFYAIRRAQIRMGADTSELPRSVLDPTRYARCDACGFPGHEFERWIVTSTYAGHTSRLTICDHCVRGYRNSDFTVTPAHA